ncbi:MAG: threonine dehydratase, partial [Bacillota bacterium]|nr:threonine dehydratase [Bacillota bacterium]
MTKEIRPADVFAAARRIGPYVRRTPLERCWALEEECGR